MRKYEWKYEEAYNFTRTKRRVIAPNPGFVQQLQLYCAMKFCVDTANAAYMSFLEELKESKGIDSNDKVIIRHSLQATFFA